jgi:hypothetical protein
MVGVYLQDNTVSQGKIANHTAFVFHPDNRDKKTTWGHKTEGHSMESTRSQEAVPQLKQLVAGFPPRPPQLPSGQHLGFVVDKAALEQGLLPVLLFPLIIIPPIS